MLLHEGLDQSDDLHSRGTRPRAVWKAGWEKLQKLKQTISNSEVPQLQHADYIILEQRTLKLAWLQNQNILWVWDQDTLV